MGCSIEDPGRPWGAPLADRSLTRGSAAGEADLVAAGLAVGIEFDGVLAVGFLAVVVGILLREGAVVGIDVAIGDDRRIARHRVVVVAIARAAGGRQQQGGRAGGRSEEHTSELQSLMRISYAV